MVNQNINKKGFIIKYIKKKFKIILVNKKCIFYLKIYKNHFIFCKTTKYFLKQLLMKFIFKKKVNKLLRIKLIIIEKNNINFFFKNSIFQLIKLKT